MHPQVPIYLVVVFLIAFIFPIMMIARLVKKYHPTNQGKLVYYGILIFYLLYLTSVSIATFNDLFAEIQLPPTIIRFTTIPLLIFLLGFIFHTSLYKKIINQTPLSALIALHLFRLIGSFFILLQFFQLLPQVFGWIAGLGDILTALSSLFVARAIKYSTKNAYILAFAWNTFGLIDILMTSAMALMFTKISLQTSSQGVEILATFPFCFIPAFAPATIIFLHLSIYRKLYLKKNL